MVERWLALKQMTESQGSLGHEPLLLSEAKGGNPNNGLFNPLINKIYMILGYNAYNSAIMAINGIMGHKLTPE